MLALLPREHGAYGQLLIPLIAALAAASPRLPSWLFAAAAAFAFASHEPLLVLMGHRGMPARRQYAVQAGYAFALTSLLALASGLSAFLLSSRSTRAAAAVSILCALAAGWHVFRRTERTAWGEIIAGAALASAALPVAAASGVTLDRALAAWVGWSVAFAAGTMSVREIIAYHRGSHQPWGTTVLVCTAVAIALLMALGWQQAALAVPLVVASIALRMGLPHPRHLKRVGWLLVAATCLGAVIAVAGERLS